MTELTVAAAQTMFEAGGIFAPWIVDLGIRIEALSAESCRARLPRNERLNRPGGVVSGQALMAFADSVLVVTFAKALGKLPVLATVSQTTNFMRAAMAKDIIVEARALKLGRTTLFGEALLRNDGETGIVASVSSVFAVLPDDSAKFNKLG